MEHSHSYEKCVEEYDTLVVATTVVSQGAAGQKSPTGRHFWASVIFTKFSVNAVSLLLLLPRNKRAVTQFEHWDFGAVASLTRNLIECYFSFFYLCVETIPEAEFEARLNLFNLHDCISRKRMFENFGLDESKIAEFEPQAQELRERLLKNSYFTSLNQNKQKEFLKGKRAFFLIQDELLERMQLKQFAFRGTYEFLSFHIHALPVSFYRMAEQDRGRGLENENQGSGLEI